MKGVAISSITSCAHELAIAVQINGFVSFRFKRIRTQRKGKTENIMINTLFWIKT